MSTINAIVVDMLQSSTFDIFDIFDIFAIDFSELDWVMITDAEMTDDLCYGRDDNEPCDSTVH